VALYQQTPTLPVAPTSPASRPRTDNLFARARGRGRFSEPARRTPRLGRGDAGPVPAPGTLVKRAGSHGGDPAGPPLLPCSPVRQPPEQCASCKRQVAILETCVLPDGTKKRGVEVTFRESAEGGILCLECEKEEG
jgi:hypothetical protein